MIYQRLSDVPSQFFLRFPLGSIRRAGAEKSDPLNDFPVLSHTLAALRTYCVFVTVLSIS